MGTQPILRAARALFDGGVVAYPTEGVFGLGCLPGSLDGAARILNIKKRDPDSGMLLIAANASQLAPWIGADVDAARLRSSVDRPVTWIVAASEIVPYWITGAHSGVAVRITQHPVAAALCDAADSAIISTSANLSGQRPARNAFVLRRRFRKLVDQIVPGSCGPATGPSEIRNLETGKVLRAGNQ